MAEDIPFAAAHESGTVKMLWGERRCNGTLIGVIENASSYCGPSYVIRTPGFFGRDSMLAHGAVLSSTDPEQQELML